jgi:hypothetical protein
VLHNVSSRLRRPLLSSSPLWFVLLSLSLISVGDVEAQEYSQFFQLERPGHLALRLFGSGYGAGEYDTTHEGFELVQTVTHEVSLIGRVTDYQIYKGTGFDNPLTPAARGATRNFLRLEGGLSVTPLQGTTLAFMGGEDVGDNNAPAFENDLSSWIWLQSRHPMNFAYSTNHFFENGVTNGLIDMRTVAHSTGRWMLLLGAGGAIWGGGSVGQAKGQGGPDVGIFLRDWRVSLDLQAGYGSSHTYGMLSLSRSFGWDE